MAESIKDMSRVTSTGRVPKWASYAACTWAFVFATLSFYWALGGTIGLSTISPAIEDLARAPWGGAMLWGTGILKVLAGLLALALVQPWGRSLPRRLLVIAAWVVGGFMVLYEGVANLMVRVVMALGLIPTPASMYSPTAYWHLVLWVPWWMLGGLLFCLAAWHARRRSYLM